MHTRVDNPEVPAATRSLAAAGHDKGLDQEPRYCRKTKEGRPKGGADADCSDGTCARSAQGQIGDEERLDQE